MMKIEHMTENGMIKVESRQVEVGTSCKSHRIRCADIFIKLVLIDGHTDVFNLKVLRVSPERPKSRNIYLL